MKKHLSALLAGVLSIAMLCSLSAFAVEPDTRTIYNKMTSQITTTTQNGITFDIYTDAHYTSGTNFKANTAVWIEANATVPANTMSARAVVMRADGYLYKDTKFKTETLADSFMWAQTGDANISYDDSVLFGGEVTLDLPDFSVPIRPKVYSIKYENGRFTQAPPINFSRSNELPVNSYGMTYGTFLDKGPNGIPDLLGAVGVDGNDGYVLRTDFSPNFYTPQARERYNERLEENNLIPLYDSELNQIGWYALAVLELAEEPDPLTQEHIQELSARNLPDSDLEPVTRTVDDSILEACNKSLVGGDLPRNAKGETFGTVLSWCDVGYDPDWYAYIGDHGVPGYMSSFDYFYAKHGNTVDLYDMDGNIVDQFTFSGTFSCD